MTARVLVVINQKGGVGKTATVHAFADGLSQMGRNVLALDLDSQQNLTFAMKAPRETAKDIYAVLTGTCSVEDAVVPVSCGDMVPGSLRLASTAGITSSEALNDALEPVREKYDDIVVDVPPGLGIISVNALVASDEVLIPIETDMLSVSGAHALYKTIIALRRSGYGINIVGLLITKFRARTRISMQMMPAINALKTEMGTRIIASRISDCTAVREAQSCGQSILEWAPKSKAALEYKAALDEILHIRALQEDE